MRNKLKLVVTTIIILVALGTATVSARYILNKKQPITITSATSNVNVTVNESTNATLTGNIASTTSNQLYTVKVSNNNNYAVTYNITTTSEHFKVTGVVANGTVAANSIASTTITVAPNTNYIYVDESDTAIIKVDITSPYKIATKTFTCDITTYGYSFNERIKANSPVGDSSTVDFSQNITTEEGSGLFTTTDESGTTYYFRGKIDNNYVYFANKMWRIVRINGDGSYRLILDSTIGREKFFTGATSAGNNIHYQNSAVKKVLEDWYSANLSAYDNYIDKNAIFWQDRTATSSSTSHVIYAAQGRLIDKDVPTPTLVAKTTADMFTVSGASKGNGLLSKPIGLITADEVVFAGGTYNASATTKYFANEGYYLFIDYGTNKVYGMWTMTPNRANIGTDNTYSTMIVSKPQAVIYTEPPGVSARFIRPVINLKSTVKIKGNGTYEKPYIITSVN